MSKKQIEISTNGMTATVCHLEKALAHRGYSCLEAFDFQASLLAIRKFVLDYQCPYLAQPQVSSHPVLPFIMLTIIFIYTCAHTQIFNARITYSIVNFMRKKIITFLFIFYAHF